MNLACLNDIITDDLAVHIDLTDTASWNYNTNYTVISLAKYDKAITDSLTLPDFGLTAYDNGRLNNINSGITLTNSDNKIKLYRIGYNNSTGGTFYNNYSITPITGSSVGTYFSLTGGYLQGFFKLYNYNYELFPSRYGNGITIETIIEILPQSYGIFYYMGTRAEDKYNPFFSGETKISGVTQNLLSDKSTGFTYTFSGITTSLGNYLVSYDNETVKPAAFRTFETADIEIQNSIPQLNNLKNNIIAFEITTDNRIGYKYIDNEGNLIQNSSPKKIKRFGWNIIDIVFDPYDRIDNISVCAERRLGDLIFYLNGRIFWKIENFDEFYFTNIENDKEKQLGVPYNISWGGGSFGLKYSYHYSGFSKNALTKDYSKQALFVETNFNSSYIGNIQKLRVYNNALDFNEVFHNAYIETINNPNYNIILSRGGRIIENITGSINMPTQTTAGSDIRKSIRYRLADGTYKNLADMTDIKVVVKSRANANVELVKYKKIADVGWLALIYVNDYTYDFIVDGTITAQHPNEILYAEIKFQWVDPFQLDNSFEKIFVVNLTKDPLVDNSVKVY